MKLEPCAGPPSSLQTWLLLADLWLLMKIHSMCVCYHTLTTHSSSFCVVLQLSLSIHSPNVSILHVLSMNITGRGLSIWTLIRIGAVSSEQWKWEVLCQSYKVLQSCFILAVLIIQRALARTCGKIRKRLLRECGGVTVLQVKVAGWSSLGLSLSWGSCEWTIAALLLPQQPAVVTSPTEFMHAA